MKTLEEYLRENIEAGNIDHAIRAQIEADGVVTFYIHPAGEDGDTLDYEVRGDGLWPNPRVVAIEG